MILRVTDGTTTETLSGDGGAITGCTYFPSPGDPATGQPLTESAVVNLVSSGDNIATRLNQIERLFANARRRQDARAGARVYVEYQAHGLDTFHRSEILDGRVLGSETPGLRRLGDASPKTQFSIAWTRLFFWESTTETELALSAKSNGTAGTGGRTVHNHNDSSEGNYVQIAAGQVGGVLPAPLKIQLTNTSGAARNYRNVYLAVNAFSDPTNFAHIIEGESVVSGYGTVQTDANSSNGQYVQRSVSGSNEMHWNIAAATVQDSAGRYVRLLARLRNNFLAPNCYVTPQMRNDDGTITLARGNEIKLPDEDPILDLGVLPLPPGGYDLGWGAQRLVLALRATSASVEIDYIQLTPLDAYRYIGMLGGSVANNDAIVDDGIEGVTYMLKSSTRHPIFAPRGEPLYVYPNVAHRIYILQDVVDTGQNSNIGETFSVRAWYRPRRLLV